MNDILGLIDSLEATLLESPKLPLSDKLIVREKTFLTLIDKIRHALKSKSNMIRESVDIGPHTVQSEAVQHKVNIPELNSALSKDASALIKEAQEKSKEIEDGANDYADYVLANLHLMVTKLQKNILKLEKSIEEGREIIDQKKQKNKQEGQST